MKKSNSILIKVLAIFILLTINSCIDFYEITTRVNADGSIDRTIRVMAGDSTSVFKGNLKVPLPNDTSWKITMHWHKEIPKDSISKKKFEYIAYKHFANAEELNKFLKVNNDTTTEIGANVEFKKQFRWFYTFVTYTETYKKRTPFSHYPIEDFMSDPDLTFFYDDNFTYSREHDSLIHIKDLKQIPILNHSDSLRKEELEKQKKVALSNFIVKNLFDEYITLTANEYALTSKEKYNYILGHKDEVLKHEVTDKELDMLLSKNDKHPFDRIDSLLNIKGNSLEKLNPELYKIFDKKASKMFNSLFSEDKIKCSTVMPGVLIQTNADSISGNQTFWNINEKYFFAKNYQLVAKSRIINKWAFILSGFIVVVLLIFIFSRVRK